MHRPLSIFVFLLFSSCLAYTQENFGGDLPFFEKKARLFQHWLESKGMGDALKVDQVRLKDNNTELELLMSLRTYSPDTAVGIWRGMEKAFSIGNPGQDLGEALFRTFARMMEIPGAQGNLQIYIPYEDGFGYNDACFYLWLWEEDGLIKREYNFNDCRSQPVEIVIRRPQVKAVAQRTTSQVDSKESAQQVFENILSYAGRRYQQEKCHDRFPKVEQVEMTDYRLTFTVSDLCQEVLTDEKRSLWCDFVVNWLGGNCNDTRRERLEFTFYYHATNGGFNLSGQLTGKFGSGVYRPRKSGYMDMEPDFEEDFLKPYVIDFQNDLKKYLER